MRFCRLQWWLAVGALLVLPAMAGAQEAALSGKVTDTTGGALPGVTIRAVHEETGNSFEATTDAGGGYRMPLRVGPYRVSAELSGFSNVVRTVALLVGQQAVLNLQMSVSGLAESVTVSGQAPLLDVTGSTLGGNIDPRQMQELPVNGRNWLDLSLLAPGARNNGQNDVPFTMGGTTIRGDFNINVDGQQVTQMISSFSGDGQPRFSRDAIAEFEFVSSRFDATQSRSSGVQINAITKSGSNTPSGSFSGYFRDDRFNAADFVAKRVLPYKDQQLSWTFGGPIRKDRIHFFANYEYERTPLTIIYNTPYPSFNVNLASTNVEHKGGGRVDIQFSPHTRLTVRENIFKLRYPRDGTAPGSGSSVFTPANMRSYSRDVSQTLGTLTEVISNRAVNELKFGRNYYSTTSRSVVSNSNGRFFDLGGPRFEFRGIFVGAAADIPEAESQDVWSLRDDFTYSFNKGGRHTMKLGAEYLYENVKDFRCVPCDGLWDATAGPVPANLEQIYPDLLDATTWKIASIPSNLVVSVTNIYGELNSPTPRNVYGAWLQDDWVLSSRLTLNLGLRYDLEINAYANNLEVLPFMPGKRPNDTNNIAPRTGFAYSLNDRTVIRGGAGIYYGTIYDPHLMILPSHAIVATTFNDGRPDFVTNPFNGPVPTYEQQLARLCTPALAPGCVTRNGIGYAADLRMPFSRQGSIGFQRQVSNTLGFEADYVYSGTRDTPFNPNINLKYDPVTGQNLPFTNVNNRIWPYLGTVTMLSNAGGHEFNLHSLQTAFTKRFSDRWQASGTYTLAGLWEQQPYPVQWAGNGTVQRVPFPLGEDLGGVYSLAIGDQRHRAVFNGLWQLAYGFQLSGVYFFGSGERRASVWGTNLRGAGANAGELRLKPDGTYVPRNSLVGDPIHRVDLRIQRRFTLHGRAGIDGIVEVFNLFNHANFGNYVTQQSSPLYGQPLQNAHVSYQPRMLQLGFRMTF